MPNVEMQGPIVVGVDGTVRTAAYDTATIAFGGWEAAHRHVGLHLVAAQETLPAMLDRLVERTALAHPDLRVTGVVGWGSPASAMVAASATASLVVVAADSRVHYGGLLAGLVSIQVAAHALTPVIVVPTPGPRPRPVGPARIVVGVDGSPGSEDAVAFAFDEAQARGATLQAVNAFQLRTRRGFRPLVERDTDVDAFRGAAEEMLREATGQWADKYPDVPVSCDAVLADNPVRALNDAGDGADLIVVGARGRGGFGTLILGSVSDGLVRYSRHAVAVARRAVRPDGGSCGPAGPG